MHVAGYTEWNTHAPYLGGFEWSDTVTWCMVEWCTQNLHQNGSISRGTSHPTSTERYQCTTSVDINNTRYKGMQSLIQNHMPMCAVSLFERKEQRCIKAMNSNVGVSKQWYGCQCLGFLTCAQMLMHVIARGGCTDSVKESALKITSRRKRTWTCISIVPGFSFGCSTNWAITTGQPS